MDRETVDKLGLTKRDCTRCISLIDFIEENRKQFASAFEESSYIRIPLNLLSASEFTLSDIKKLSEILGKPLIIKDENFAVENAGNDLILRKFLPRLIKEQLQKLSEELPDNTGVITLFFDKNILQRDYDGTLLTCPFEEEKEPSFVFNDILRSKKSKRNSDFSNVKNLSRTISEINKRTAKLLHLNSKEPLIESDGGYRINTQKYLVI